MVLERWSDYVGRTVGQVTAILSDASCELWGIGGFELRVYTRTKLKLCIKLKC